MTVLQFGCPFCGAVSEIDAGQAGQETVCPACENVLLVPQPEDVAGSGSADTVSIEPATLSKPGSKPRTAKTKLWKKAQGSTVADGQPPTSSPELPQPVLPESTLPASNLVTPVAARDDSVVDLSMGPEGHRDASPFGRRSEAIARQERERRRLISNAVMLVGSMAILVGALAGLMYLVSK